MKTEKKIDKPINFDDFSSNYEDKILKSFGNIDSNVSYYHSGKAKITKRFAMFALKDTKPGEPLLLHDEPIYLNNKIIGRNFTFHHP